MNSVGRVDNSALKTGFFRKFGTKQQRCFGIFPQNGEITPASTASWQIYKRNRFKAGVAAFL